MPSESPALDAQIRWKTDAWKDPSAASIYAERVGDTGANILKNRVEVRMFPRYVTGSDVLDVGIGTGRASIPLARAGYRVTGTDSSQAMLDKCRELAGETPLTLLTGDVAKLPFDDASFDTVMALNTFAHFPHWQLILREWRRVTRGGGRLIFDVFSLDHDIAFARAAGRDEKYAVEEFAPKDLGSYHLRLRVEELTEFASQAGLRVHAIVPYSALCGKGTINRFIGPAVEGFAWDRQLSWTGADGRLLDLLLLLEEEIVARLTSAATWRFMVVLDVENDPAHNRAWIEQNRAHNEALFAGLSGALLEQRGADLAKLREALRALLEHEPNRYVLAHLLLANVAWNWPVNLRDFLADADAAELEKIFHRGALDRIAMTMIRALPALSGAAQHLTYSGIDLSEVFAYSMAGRVLDKGMNAFE